MNEPNTSGTDPDKSHNDAVAIWQAGVDAVQSDVLVRDRLRIRDGQFVCDGFTQALNSVDRVVVIGGGKAGAGMATGLEQVFAESEFSDLPITGWINVPDDCVRELAHIHLHPARPAGINEPTEAGVTGSQKILELVQSATQRDLVICLVSGGGSALLPLPVEGVTWQDKRTVTQLLSGAGADIRQLNTVRKQLSAIKGGRLALACTHSRMLTLILSDVIGDPLDVIASGLTVPNTTSVHDAISVLKQFFPDRDLLPESVRKYLRVKRATTDPNELTSEFPHVTNVVLGNNQTAVEAARIHAQSLGYKTVVVPMNSNEGHAEDVAKQLAASIPNYPSGTCVLSGGEPTVELVDAQQRGKGGRNQQLVLAALSQIVENPGLANTLSDNFALLSAGTDGEDGPTDAAGGILDKGLIAELSANHGLLEAAYEALKGNDAYSFLDAHGSLLRTGPTHTNVCDLRVLLT